MSNEDFQKVAEWASSHPEELKAAEDFRQEVIKEADTLQDKYRDMDIGVYAALRGYDAINAENHGKSGSYTVILNRTKTLFLDSSDDEHKDSTEESPITFQIGEDGLIYAIRDGKVIGWVCVSNGFEKS